MILSEFIHFKKEGQTATVIDRRFRFIYLFENESLC